MFSLPNHVLEKLRCVQCGGYLNCGPIGINKNLEQLCGRCFKIHPEKNNFVREIGLETVAQSVVFPCRYSEQGCSYTFPWNNNEHELNCEHRYKTLPLEKSYSEESFPNEIDMKVHCDSYTNHNFEDKLRLGINLTGKSGHKLCLNNTKNVRLGVEITLSVDPPKVEHSSVSVEEYEESLYESISVYQGSKCPKCQNAVFDHTCLFCRTKINLQQCCKNYSRGCTQIFSNGENKLHEIDCEFNDFKCPLCSFENTLDLLLKHFVQTHKDAIFANELNVSLGSKDQVWYFYCYNKLFCCKYYNFDDSVEFVISYIGSNDKACDHRYKVTLFPDTDKSVSKQMKCLGWNEKSLGKAVVFEVIDNFRKKLQVRISIL